jgi:3-methylfumaryl-CoA hydratase
MAAAPAVDLARLRQWVGREAVDDDVLGARHARLMAATLGLAAEASAALVDGAALPPLWHWLYFLSAQPPAALGRDGHPARGGFLPPVPLPHRMWAGGDVEFLQPLPLGAAVRKHSAVQSVDARRGRSGELVFVAVQHTLRLGDATALRERHDIVYLGARPPAAAAAPAAASDLPRAEHSEPFTTDPTLLFRYSALTFNGHRIHYDLDYCRSVEGYAGLVVHGPLLATVLAGLAQRLAPRPLRRFGYRALQPALCGQPLQLCAARTADDTIEVWVALPDGSAAMRAQAAC